MAPPGWRTTAGGADSGSHMRTSRAITSPSWRAAGGPLGVAHAALAPWAAPRSFVGARRSLQVSPLRAVSPMHRLTPVADGAQML